MPENSVLFTTPRVLHTHLELDFLLNEVFLGISFTTDLMTAKSARTIVYAEHDFDLNIVAEIKNSGSNFILLHLGDERATKDLSAYVHADAILRNYYFDHILFDHRWRHKIHWIPNGYRSGVGTRDRIKPKKISDRKRLAIFIGWLDNKSAEGNERVKFANSVQNCTDLVQCIPTQGFASGFSPTLYRYFMEDAVFAPSPSGNAHETIRLCDAMEIGCIPISTRHPYLENPHGLPGAPVIVLDDWLDLPIFLKSAQSILAENKNLFDELQEDVIRYWTGTKRKYNALAAMILSGGAEKKNFYNQSE